jgi:lysophospholipase L1-like esterase
MRSIIFNVLIYGTIVSAILLGSCAKQNTIVENEISFEPIKFLALGDSYTIGQGIEETLSWPVQLGEQLEANDYQVDIIDIIARTGWTTERLIDSIENTELIEYNLVSLLIGVNNQFRNQSFEVFKSEFDALLDMSIGITGEQKKVFVVSIPDYGVTPFGQSNREKIAEEIDEYNNYISMTCNNRNIPYIDITEISRRLGDSPGALASDNLHPSGSQYAEWVDEILPVVITLLNE